MTWAHSEADLAKHRLFALGFTNVAFAGTLAGPYDDKLPAQAVQSPAAAPAAPAQADKIKAEHSRSSSAMPSLSPLKLDTKSSLLPSAAAEAARAAQEDAAANLLGSQTSAQPSSDARSKAGLHDCHLRKDTLVAAFTFQ